MDDLIKRDCPLCGSRNSNVKYKRNYKIEELKEEFFSARRERRKASYDHNTFLTCNDCGLVYASPIINPGLTEKLYKKSKFNYGDEAENLKKSYGAILKKIEKYVKEKGKILDIGCGNGFFLEEALDQGYNEVHGIEPSKHAVDLASERVKKNIIIDILKDGQFKKNSFDVICIFQTVDHIINLNEFLKICHSYLKKGGIILCVSHNIEALSAKIMGEKSVIIDIEHTQLFSMKTMPAIFKRNGFRPIEVFNVKNIYKLGYWLKISPVPLSIKSDITKLFKALGLLNKDIGIKPGNMGLVAIK